MFGCDATVCCDTGLSQPQCTRALMWSGFPERVEKKVVPEKVKEAFLDPLVWIICITKSLSIQRTLSITIPCDIIFISYNNKDLKPRKCAQQKFDAKGYYR